MSKATKLKKIVIAIAGQELELSPDQAKELRDILMELYGKEVVRHEHHHDYWRPYYPWVPCTTTTIDCTNLSSTAGDFTTLNANQITSGTLRLEAVA